MIKVGAVLGKYTPKTIVTSPTRTPTGKAVVEKFYNKKSEKYQAAFIQEHLLEQFNKGYTAFRKAEDQTSDIPFIDLPDQPEAGQEQNTKPLTAAFMEALLQPTGEPNQENVFDLTLEDFDNHNQKYLKAKQDYEKKYIESDVDNIFNRLGSTPRQLVEQALSKNGLIFPAYTGELEGQEAQQVEDNLFGFLNNLLSLNIPNLPKDTMSPKDITKEASTFYGGTQVLFKKNEQEIGITEPEFPTYIFLRELQASGNQSMFSYGSNGVNIPAQYRSSLKFWLKKVKIFSAINQIHHYMPESPLGKVCEQAWT